jgi:IclR family mhp operon transcriptional activator
MEVLQAINKLGSGRLVDIAELTDIPYPTVCRIVETLEDINLIEREQGRRYYRPTPLVQSLALGFQESDQLVRAGQPIISALCQKVGWPITIGTRVGNAMMIRASTHRETTLTYKIYYPGYTLPLLESSIGKATVSFCSDCERSDIRKSLRKSQANDPLTSLYLHDEAAFIEPYRAVGYAYHTGAERMKNPEKTSSLSVPIYINGVMKGALGLVYFSTAMGTQDAAEKYLEAMQKAAGDIERSF